MEKSPSKNKLSLILYESESAPRYFEIKKKYLRLIVWGLPIITAVSLLLLLSGSLYFKKIREFAAKKEPAIILGLREKNQHLQAQVKEINNLNKLLQNKLSQGDIKASGLGSLSLFKPIPGQKDLSVSPQLSVDEASLKVDKENIEFRFNLINETKEGEKLAGYIFVLMKVAGGVQFYPAGSLPDEELALKFNNGEYFAASRYRPVRAVFKSPEKPGPALFKIIIFNRTGDLLHKRIISEQLEF